GSLADRQWWFLAGMLPAVGVDPVTEGAFLDVQLAGDPSDGLGTLGDHLDRFFAEFRRKSLTLFWHQAPRFWTETLLGPCPESKRRSKTWWRWAWSHGQRWYLEQLPADRIDEFQHRAFEQLQPLRTDHGIPLDQNFMIAKST